MMLAPASRTTDQLPRRTPLHTALVLLRVGTAALLMAHALVRVLTPGSIPQFGAFLTRTGLPYGEMLVWGITVFELAAGSMLVVGYRARLAALGFIAMLLAGIVLIHRHLGWFVGEHGTGGSEYSVALILALLVIAAADDGGAWRNDRPVPATIVEG